MKTIKISDTVHAAIEASGKSADELLRKALHVKPEGMGEIFPPGTAFVAWYKNRAYWGHIVDGALVMGEGGETFTSVSAAAGSITGRPTNGWDFWLCKFPGKADFVRINKLRDGPVD